MLEGRSNRGAHSNQLQRPLRLKYFFFYKTTSQCNEVWNLQTMFAGWMNHMVRGIQTILLFFSLSLYISLQSPHLALARDTFYTKCSAFHMRSRFSWILDSTGLPINCARPLKWKVHACTLFLPITHVSTWIWYLGPCNLWFLDTNLKKDY